MIWKAMHPKRAQGEPRGLPRGPKRASQTLSKTYKVLDCIFISKWTPKTPPDLTKTVLNYLPKSEPQNLLKNMPKRNSSGGPKTLQAKSENMSAVAVSCAMLRNEWAPIVVAADGASTVAPSSAAFSSTLSSLETFAANACAGVLDSASGHESMLQ